MKKKEKLHTDERILLFLSEFISKKELWDVPPEVTQKGISSRLDILENNVSRALKRLRKDDLVSSVLKHVKGEKRRQKAYFPTDAGLEVSEKLKKRIARLTIKVITEDGERTLHLEKALREARDHGSNITLAELQGWKFKEKGPFTITPKGPGGKKAHSLVGNYNHPPHFFGREKELREIKDFIGSDSGVLLIWGIAGIGKTTLILKGLSNSPLRAGYVRCEPWTDRIELITEIEEVVNELGGKELGKADMEMSPGQLSRVLKEISLDLGGLIIIIDDLQKTGGGIDIYMEGLCKASFGSSKLKVVILTRERPRFLDPRFELHGDVVSMELVGLDPKAVGQMIRAEGAGVDAGSIWDMTKGHPLFVELMLSSLGATARSRFGDFLEKEIISALTESHVRVLRMVSLSSVPSHRSILGDTSPEEIEVLRRKGLLEEVNGLYYVHDLISEHLDISRGNAKEIEKEVLAYQMAVVLRVWEDGSELLSADVLKGELSLDEDIVRSIVNDYSGIEFENEPELRKRFGDYLDAVIARCLSEDDTGTPLALIKTLSSSSGKGRAKVLLAPIKRLEEHLKEEDKLLQVRLIKAGMEAMEGRWESASSTLDVLEASTSEGLMNPKQRAKMKHLKGQISRAQEKLDETIRSHLSAISTYESIGDRKGVEKERLHLAKAYHLNGDFSNALKEAVRSASGFAEIHDREGEAYACLQAYRSASAGGKDTTAQRCLKRSIELSERLSDTRLAATISLERLLGGVGLQKDQDFEETEEKLEMVRKQDKNFTIRGQLRISRHLEGSGRKHDLLIRAQCLARAWELINEPRRGEGLNIIAGLKDRNPHLLENLSLRIELLEQALQMVSSLESRAIEPLKIKGFPFLKKRGGDLIWAHIHELSGAYEQLVGHRIEELSSGHGDPKDLDEAVEGHVYTLIMAGNRFQSLKKKKKSRMIYRRCDQVLQRYEEILSDGLEHVPGFDIRKVKEVLDHNRSKLEEDRT